jgi:ATP-dependent protease ClpP protease subunit
MDRDDYVDTQFTYCPSGSHSNKRMRCTVEDKPEATGESQPSSAATSKETSTPLLSDPDLASRCVARGNHIYFFSGVSKDSVYRLKDCLDKINDNYRDAKLKNPTLTMQPKPIYLHINSYGGGVFAAFAAIDFIQQSEIPVHTIIEGASASAATLMSVVGKKRYIRPHASMLVHQLSSWFGGKLSEIEDDYKNVTQMHDTIKEIYKKHTNLCETDLEEILKHDLWWKADKCMQTGLADELWEQSE